MITLELTVKLCFMDIVDFGIRTCFVLVAKAVPGILQHTLVTLVSTYFYLRELSVQNNAIF